MGTRRGAGTTSNPQSYAFTDSRLPYEAGELTYRLKQVDADGTVRHSEPVAVRRGITQVELRKTHPNPAADQITVHYALPDRQKVKIRLYDVLGRRIRTVVSERKTGRKQERLDVDELPSGVYFLRLETDEKIRTRKVTVVH